MPRRPAPRVPEVSEILGSVSNAIHSFLRKEGTLLAIDINERSLTHKLAEHLQSVFGEWDVDCEYNRDINDVKRLPSPTVTNTADTEGSTIYPDIVVHQRRQPNNMLVIEVKKTGSRILDDAVRRDIEKLKGLTSTTGQYQYRCGIYLYIDCAGRRISEAHVYENGRRDRARSREFLDLLR